MKPHIHQKEIIAWANGADIQYQNYYGKWFDCQGQPAWVETTKYRVKPNVRDEMIRWFDQTPFYDMDSEKIANKLLANFNITLKEDK